MHLREKNIFHLKWRDFGEKWSLEFVAEDTSPKFLTLPAKICQNCRKNANFLREVLFEKDDKSVHTCDDKLQRIHVE